MIGVLISLVGWFGFQSVILLVIGTLLYLVETILEWNNLNANAKMLDVVIIALGCLIGPLITNTPWYVCGLLAINFYSALVNIPGIIIVVVSFVIAIFSGKNKEP